MEFYVTQDFFNQFNNIIGKPYGVIGSVEMLNNK